MSSPRQAYDALARWMAPARRTRYEPLAQDSSYSLSTKKTRYRLPPSLSLCRLFAYIAAGLSVILLFAVYTHSDGGQGSSATETESSPDDGISGPGTGSLVLPDAGADTTLPGPDSSLPLPSTGTGTHSTTPSPSPSAPAAVSKDRVTLSKEDYSAAVVNDPVEGLVDLAPIQQKCDEVKFHEGLVWHCAPVNGGIGNVVNMVLNCVRYALEAGATTLILPRISIRADNLIDLGTKDQDNTAEMSYLLDAEYFLSQWKLACPQMRAFTSESQAEAMDPNLNITSMPKENLSPNQLKSFPMHKYLIVDPTGWREAFDEWLAKKSSIFGNMSASSPSRVWQTLAFAQWNRYATLHTPEFANSFPRLFRNLPQTRRLAAAALWSLEQKMNLNTTESEPHYAVSDTILFPSAAPQAGVSPTNLSSSSNVNSLGPSRLSTNGFLGAHLRVAADAKAAGWPGYDAQAPFYIDEAKARNLPAIYLATGSAENRDKFRQDASLENLTVYTKEDLLNETELAELKKLSWDQQALVDFEVLMHASVFYGFVRSSYSWMLALRRGLLPEAGEPTWSEGEHEYWDGLSRVVGRYGSINPEGLWP